MRRQTVAPVFRTGRSHLERGGIQDPDCRHTILTSDQFGFTARELVAIDSALTLDRAPERDTSFCRVPDSRVGFNDSRDTTRN